LITRAICRALKRVLCITAKIGRPCPLWVKSGHRSASSQCPLCPRKRTSIIVNGMSALCHSVRSTISFGAVVCPACLYGGEATGVDRVPIGKPRLLSCCWTTARCMVCSDWFIVLSAPIPGLRTDWSSPVQSRSQRSPAARRHRLPGGGSRPR